MIRALVLIALLLTACGDHVGSGGVSGVSSSPTPSPATPSSVATPTAPATAPIVAFPDRLSFVAGTSDGFVYPEFVQGKPAGKAVRACEGPVGSLASFGRKVLVVCRDETLRLGIFDVDAGTFSVIPSVQAYEAAWTINGDAVVFTTPGTCEPSAPICKTKLMQRDLRTAATIQLDERYGVGRDLRMTGNGIMVWRAANMDSFVRPANEVGTWFVRETTLVRFSPYRFVDGYKGRYVLETEETSFNAGCCTTVMSLTDREQRLTPSSISNERAIAWLQDGRIVAFRPDPGNLFEGAMVIYGAGVVERVDRGKFSAVRVVRDADWIVGFEFSGARAGTLRAYRVSDGTFASTSVANITVLAPLAPAKSFK